MKITFLTLSAFLFLACASQVYAHEVYVLSPGEVAQAIDSPFANPLVVIMDHFMEFVSWGIGSILIVLLIFFISTRRVIENTFAPLLVRMKKYAPRVSRITLGFSFIAAAIAQASYGPELPLSASYGSFTPVITGVLAVMGLLLILGVWVRTAATVALVMYINAFLHNGFYMLTYANYLGEIVLLMIVGAHHFNAAPGKGLSRSYFLRIQEKLAPLAPAILRILFGVALIYSSVYAKILHSNLALTTVIKYQLTHYLPFEPHFLVLGASLVEIMAGVFFILGIEIRFMAVFLIFWLSLSLLFFGEVVWPHIMLFGIPLALLLYGYDRYSLMGYFFARGDREPVL